MSRLAPEPKGDVMCCALCGFAAIRGLNTAMRVMPNGQRIHVKRDVCKALQEDPRLRAEVIKLYGEPQVPASVPSA